MYSKYKTVSIEDDLVFNSSTLKGFVTIVCGRVTHTKNFSKLLRRERRTKRGKSVSDFFFTNIQMRFTIAIRRRERRANSQGFPMRFWLN